jgi:hypothetical protein
MLATLIRVARQRNFFNSTSSSFRMASSTTLSGGNAPPVVDLDFVHPEIRVPIVPRIKLFGLPKPVSRDWLRKALAKVRRNLISYLFIDFFSFFFFFL